MAQHLLILKTCDFPGCQGEGTITSVYLTLKAHGRRKKSGMLDVCDQHRSDLVNMLGWNDAAQKALDSEVDHGTQDKAAPHAR